MTNEMHPPYSYLPGALFPADTFPVGTTFNGAGGIAVPPRVWGGGQRLWSYARTAVVLCVSALGFLLFCIAFNDRFFRGAAFLTTAAFVGAAIMTGGYISHHREEWNSVFPLQFGFAFLLLSALCGAVAALRREELPALDEIFGSGSERRQQAASQPPRPGILTHRLTTPAARAILIALAVTSLLGACVAPVLQSSSPYGSASNLDVYRVSLFDYAPIFPLIMLAPLVLMIYGITAGRNDIRQVGAGLGTLLTFGLVFQLWRDMRDRANDYAYGIFATSSYRHLDNLAVGFWLLGLTGLCWFTLNFDDPEAANRAAQSTPPGAKPRVAPVDFGDIAVQILTSLLAFVFCLSVFPLGIFLWRYFDEQDNRLAPVALCGWVLGFVFWLGRFLLVGARALHP